MESPYGRIASNWKKDKNRLTLDVTIPCNTTALVCIPVPPRRGGGDPDGVSESGVPISKNPDIKVLGRENDRMILKLGSGIYHLVSVFNTNNE
jgi:alpha-L-rhamnosidase